MDATSTLRRALTAACAVVALAAAPASAATASPDHAFPVGGATMTAAYEAAVGYWGATPCGGAVTMVWSPMDVGHNALSTWMTVDPKAPATFTDCRIAFNPAVEFDPPKLCTIMLHEVGHLLGQAHVTQAGQLMSEYYAGPVPACTGGAWTTTAATAASKRKRKRAPKARAATRRKRATAARAGKRARSKARARRAAAASRLMPAGEEQRAANREALAADTIAVVLLGGLAGVVAMRRRVQRCA